MIFWSREKYNAISKNSNLKEVEKTAFSQIFHLQ